MLSWRKARMPPVRIITNTTSISTRCLSANPISPFMGSYEVLRPPRPEFLPMTSVPAKSDIASAADGNPVDEQASLGDHVLARPHAVQHLDHASAGEAGSHLPQLDRLVVA